MVRSNKQWSQGDYCITYSGVEVSMLDPKPEQITLKDIAHHLAMICRYGGATPLFYSVASHSMYVADILPDELKAEGLLHDAAEAYVGDMVKGLKRHMAYYREIEDLWEVTIRSRFGLKPHMPADVKAAVKRADISALLAERRDIFGDVTPYEAEGVQPGEPRCRALYPQAAEAAFMGYAIRLGLDRL
jgi:hypothetical protein